MKKILLITFTALVMLVVVSCKKSKDNPSEDALGKDCLLTQAKSSVSTQDYTYDSQGRVATMTDNESIYTNIYTYAYASDKIVVTSKSNYPGYNGQSLTTTYLLDEKGRIASYTLDGGRTSHTNTYNTEGYLAKTLINYKGGGGSNDTKTEKRFTWANSNLVKEETFVSDNSTATQVDTYEYGSDLAPFSYNKDALSKYLGKQSKNLPVKWGLYGVVINFTYTKDNKGNIVSRMMDGSITDTYNYDCK